MHVVVPVNSSITSAIMVANGTPLVAIPTTRSISPCFNAMSLKAAATYLSLVALPPKLFQLIAMSTGASVCAGSSFLCNVNHCAVSIDTLSSSAISPVVNPWFLSS